MRSVRHPILGWLQAPLGRVQSLGIYLDTECGQRRKNPDLRPDGGVSNQDFELPVIRGRPAERDVKLGRQFTDFGTGERFIVDEQQFT